MGDCLNFAVLGCGDIARRHCSLISSEIRGARLVAVCDADEVRVSAFAREFNVPGFTKLELMMADVGSDIDIVNICEPSVNHVNHATAAASHGKHVLVEMPVALPIDDAKAIIRSCDKVGVQLFVVPQNRFSLPMQKLREAVVKGRFGRIVMAGAHLHWCRDRAYRYQDAGRDSRKWDGGAFASQASHHIDLLNWLLGDVDSVFAYTSRQLVDIECEDAGVAVLSFRNGALGAIEATTGNRCKSPEASLTILGERGSVEIGGFSTDKINAWNFEDYSSEDDDLLAKSKEPPTEVYHLGYREYFNQIVSSIREGDPAKVNGLDVLKSLRVVSAVSESTETGAEVQLRREPEQASLDMTLDRRTCRIAPTARIHPNVRLGQNVVIDDFCIIGYPPGGCEPGELETVIGSNTTIRSHAVLYAGCHIGDDCHIAHFSFIREHTTIGPGVSVGFNVVIEHHCQVGKNVRIQGQTGLAEYTIVEDNAWIGPRVLTTNVPHPTCKKAKECLSGPIVRDGAIIGANVVLGPNLEIGRNSLIGSASNVVKSVEDETIVFGNPARKIGTRDQLSCPYDMMGDRGPYDFEPPDPTPQIPLVDLVAQHQAHKQEIRLAIDRVILNTRFIKGKEVGQFEEEFAAFCGTKHAIGVSNGTSALILSLKAMGIASGDEVITASHTFIATAEAIAEVGARPVLADIDEESYTIDPNEIASKITPNTKAIIPVHLYGNPAAMVDIVALAEERGIKIIEDAAQAHGARIGEKTIGQWGDCACFSFYPGKNLGAYGDAGGIVTDDDDLAQRLRMLRDHGRTSKYISEEIGTNARLDTIQAAVLRVKLGYLEKWNQGRREIAAYYGENLKGLPITLPVEREGCDHVYHVFTIRVPERDRLAEFLTKKGISTGIYYPVPVHLQPAFSYLGYGEGDLPVTEKICGEIISLPIYPELSTEHREYVVASIREFFS